MKRWLRARLGRMGLGPGAHYTHFMKPKLESRNDRTRHEVQPELVFEVFWKDLPIGRGPAVSVWACGHEVLRFDCFGPQRGHYHVAFCKPGRARYDNRLFFFESTREGQIERTAFELTRNLRYYLQRIPLVDIQRLEVDGQRLQQVVAEVRSRLLELAAIVPENKPA